MSPRRVHSWLGALAGVFLVGAVGAQESPVTRQAAVDAALMRGARQAAAVADTMAGAAQVALARQWQNPSISVSYSKDIPQHHYALELPLDLPYIRGPRVGSALAAQRAGRARFVYERASVAMEADTAYTRALAAKALAALSTRNAHDADSLRRMAIARRDAGDASDMDVALATITAGQAANDATTDSLTLHSALLDLQIVMGIPGRDVRIGLRDSITPPPPPALVADGPPIAVAAAANQLEAASLALRVEKRSVIGQPAITAGWDSGDPTGDTKGRLPTFGVALPIPLFNRNTAAISLAQAEEARARAELSLITVTSRTERQRAEREYAAARARFDRDEQLVTQAERVAAMALTAYREGAMGMASVLEARRTARELLAQRVRDAADAWVAVAELKVLTLTTAPVAP